MSTLEHEVYLEMTKEVCPHCEGLGQFILTWDDEEYIEKCVCQLNLPDHDYQPD